MLTCNFQRERLAALVADGRSLRNRRVHESGLNALIRGNAVRGISFKSWGRSHTPPGNRSCCSGCRESSCRGRRNGCPRCC